MMYDEIKPFNFQNKAIKRKLCNFLDKSYSLSHKINLKWLKFIFNIKNL